MNRNEAAKLLRALRSDSSRCCESLDWALTMLPDSPIVQRLHIDALLHDGDVAGAEAAAARGLMLRPSHASLRLARACCLMARQRWTLAEQELAQLLNERPWHRRTRRLAAEAASCLGRHRQAANLLEPLAAAGDDHCTQRMIQALLQAGEVDAAADALAAMQCKPPLLAAAVLRAQGRELDAADCLEAELCARFGHESATDEFLCAMLDVMEAVGDRQRLQRVIDRIGPEHPCARLRLAEIHLSRGEFRAAARCAAALSRSPRHQIDALPTLVVAAAMLGRSRLARRVLGRLQRTRRGIDAAVMARRWQRALLGRQIRTLHDAKLAGCDPAASVLRVLLNDARGRGGAGGACGASAGRGRKKSRRIMDSAGGAHMSERNVPVSLP